MTDDDKALVERLRDFVIVEDIDAAADRIETLNAMLAAAEESMGDQLAARKEQADRIEAQAAEIERLREALEIWIFHHQRAMGEKPDVARQYAKAWMFRNANGEEPE